MNLQGRSPFIDGDLPSTNREHATGADAAVPMEHAGMQDVSRRRSRSSTQMQITMSPYYGKPDFSNLGTDGVRGRIDPVSVADILRNAFVYPPHSIFEDIKLATFGFFPHHDMQAAPEFHYRFRDAGKSGVPDDGSADLVGTYHQLLCQAITRSCKDIQSPWLLQSGGKDSSTLAIAR